MSWYRIVHVLIPYNIKLYTALHSSEFDYRVRTFAEAGTLLIDVFALRGTGPVDVLIFVEVTS